MAKSVIGRGKRKMTRPFYYIEVCANEDNELNRLSSATTDFYDSPMLAWTDFISIVGSAQAHQPDAVVTESEGDAADVLASAVIMVGNKWGAKISAIIVDPSQQTIH